MKHLRKMGLIAAGSMLVFAFGCPEDEPDPDRPEVTEYEVELVGENEVPPIATPASGEMEVELDDNDVLNVSGEFGGLVSPLFPIDGTAAHIHQGAANETGPVLFNVEITADADQRGGTFSFARQLSEDEVDLFEDNLLYLNIHSEAYPGGELRGQLDPDAPEYASLDESWGVTLTAAAQPHDVETEGDGWVWMILRTDDTIAVSGAANNLTSELLEVDGSAVNIEEAERGETGPTVLNLEYESLPDIDGVRFWGTAELTSEQVDELEDGNYYITIYTDDYPQGELRGQFDVDGFFDDFWDNFFGDGTNDIFEAPPF